MSTEKNWAQGPYKLIETPRLRLNGAVETECSKFATEMACVHNILIRGLNAIVLQIHGVKEPQDVADFLDFVFAWSHTIHEHHANEEANTFPMLEAETGEKGVMEKNVVQHHAFTPGFEVMEKYVEACREKKDTYNAQKLQGLFDAFAPLLTEHLRDEVNTLLDLERFGDKIDWKTFTKELDKKTLGNVNLTYAASFVLCNMDLTFEGGLHRDRWPPFPWFVGYVLRWFYIGPNKRWWRFATCDQKGMPKDLPFSAA